MLIKSNPDDYKTEVNHYVCPYHRKHPGENYAGCGCHSIYTQKRKNVTEKIKSFKVNWRP